MKRFLKKIVLFFLLPIMMLWVVEIVFLPINYFNYRNWEALLMNTELPHYGPFYPNVTVHSVEEGDLAFHSPFSVRKEVTWKTDDLGFRNDSVIKNPDIIVIGDSFMAGTSLTQEAVFSNQLSKVFQNRYKVYTLAPFNFLNWTELLDQGIIKKPKYLIFSCVERNVPEYFTPSSKNYASLKEKIKRNIREYQWGPKCNRLSRFYALKWLSARIKNKQGGGIQSPVNPKMFFYQGNTVMQRDNREVEETVKAIESYQNYCNQIGVQFIFVPMPNKESVYYKNVPLKDQPEYLFKVDSLLRKKKIKALNTLQLYNENQAESLYQLDDTHWNQKGVKIVAKAIKDYNLISN